MTVRTHIARVFSLVGLMVLACPLAARPPAPGAQCLDARDLREMHQPLPGILAVIDHRGDRYRLDLATDCPVVPGATSLLAPHGWVCGLAGEFVRAGERECGIQRVTVIDAKAYAALAVASQRDADGMPRLATVRVTAEKRRGFLGSPSYCFAPAHMRGWSVDRLGIVVEMSPRRAGGNRWYRVELAGSCVELNTASRVLIESGVGNGLVCGNAGDRVVNAPEPLGAFAEPFAGRLRGRGETFGCPVTAVYPIDKTRASE